MNSSPERIAVRLLGVWLLGLGCSSLLAAEPLRVTTDGTAKQDPLVTADGRAVIYTVYESATQMSLWRVELPTGQPERVHPQANTSEFEPALSPSGRHLAFVQSRGNLNLKMVIEDLETKQQAVYDPGGGFAGVHCPTFTPNGERVTFSQPGKGGQQLMSVNLQGQDRKDVTTWAGFTNWPSYTADGQQILCGSSHDGDFEIYLLSTAGGEPRRLTQQRGRDVRPRLSPNGRRIAFVSSRDGNPEVYVMHADGTHVQRITQNAERDDYPTWHPNNRQLVLMSERQGRCDLYLVDVP